MGALSGAQLETGLVWAAILPHGPDVVLEVTEDPALMAETRSAMEEAGRRFAAARPDTVILLDPLLVHEQNLFEQRLLFRGEGTLPVGVAARAGGRAAVFAGRRSAGVPGRKRAGRRP